MARWQEFINALTTNLTAFSGSNTTFPSWRTFSLHRASASPCLVQHHRIHWRRPYSLAMTLADTLGANARFTLQCNDIDTKVLAAAAIRITKPKTPKGSRPSSFASTS